MICTEIMLTACILNFIFFSIFFEDKKIQVLILFIIVIIACESILGLSLIIVSYRLKISINLIFFNKLSG